MLPIYYGKKFTVAQVGAALVHVECTQCRCQYAYSLARVSSAEATSHYGLAQKSAADTAQLKSQAMLAQRLLEEAELVPCPKCNWINDELVQGYRRGRFRSWGKVAVYGAIAGIALSLIVAWFIHIDPQADRALLPYFLVGGPILIAGMAASVFALRAWLRNQIQPNRYFPMPPVIPRGTPPALVADRATGEFVPAATRTLGSSLPASDSEVEFQMGRDELPPICCVCSGSMESNCGVSVPVLSGLEVRLPLCVSCSRQRSRVRWLVGLVAVGVSFGVMAGGIQVLEFVDEWPFLMTCAIVLACAIGGVASHFVGAPARVRVIDASRGVLGIRFRDPSFVKHFAEHNAHHAPSH